MKSPILPSVKTSEAVTSHSATTEAAVKSTPVAKNLATTEAAAKSMAVASNLAKTEAAVKSNLVTSNVVATEAAVKPTIGTSPLPKPEDVAKSTTVTSNPSKTEAAVMSVAITSNLAKTEAAVKPTIATNASASTEAAAKPTTVLPKLLEPEITGSKSPTAVVNASADSAGKIKPTPLLGMFDFSAPEGALVGRSYWMEPRTIVAVMLRPIGKPQSYCSYQGIMASGVRYLHHLGDMHGARVAPVVAFCTFSQDTPAPADGKRELAVVEAGYKIPVFNWRPKIATPPNWTVCFPPLHMRPRYFWVDQVLKYYVRKLQPDHFFMYTAIEGQTRQSLLNDGVEVAMTHASVLNLASQQSYKPYYFGQTFAIHDCLYMNRQLQTSWVIFQDYDEVLTPPARFPTAFDFFQSSKEYTAITLGTWPVDVDVCLSESSVTEADKDWPLLIRFIGKHKKPYCGQLCRNWQGRRKYALKPHGHERLFVHDPLGGYVRHVAIDDGHLRHYWSVQDTGMHYCTKIQTS